MKIRQIMLGVSLVLLRTACADARVEQALGEFNRQLQEFTQQVTEVQAPKLTEEKLKQLQASVTHSLQRIVNVPLEKTLTPQDVASWSATALSNLVKWAGKMVNAAGKEEKQFEPAVATLKKLMVANPAGLKEESLTNWFRTLNDTLTQARAVYRKLSIDVASAIASEFPGEESVKSALDKTSNIKASNISEKIVYARIAFDRYLKDLKLSDDEIMALNRMSLVLTMRSRVEEVKKWLETL